MAAVSWLHHVSIAGHEPMQQALPVPGSPIIDAREDILAMEPGLPHMET